MTLEQLRIFVAVAEREHVTQAAAALGLTQSATSAAISALEARYAVKLFDRIGRRISLTQAGRLFLPDARAVLARAAAAAATLDDLTGLRRGSLTLAASQTVGNYWLPPLLAAFRHRYPNVSVSLSIGNTATVATAVREGAVDLGFVEGEVDDPLLAVSPVAEDEVVVVAAPSFAAHAPEPLSAETIVGLPWVLREAGSGTRDLFERVLGTLSLGVADLDVVLELPSNEAVRAAVANGAGATAISGLAVSQMIESGQLILLDLTLPKRRFVSLRLKEREASRAELALMAIAASQSATKEKERAR